MTLLVIYNQEKKRIKKLDNYMNELPNKFYSENYIEIMKYKNKICNNNYELLKNIENIDKLFSSLESYYEQLSVIENLFNDIEIQSKDNNKNNLKKNEKTISKKAENSLRTVTNKLKEKLIKELEKYFPENKKEENKSNNNNNSDNFDFNDLSFPDYSEEN